MGDIDDDEALEDVAAPKLRGPWYGYLRRVRSYQNSILFTLVAIGVLINAYVIGEDLWGKDLQIARWSVPVPPAPNWGMVTVVVIVGAFVGGSRIIRGANLQKTARGLTAALLILWVVLTPKEVTAGSLTVFACSLALIAGVYAMLNALRRRSPGYYWVLPAIAVFIFATVRALDGQGRALATVTAVLLLGALGCRIFYRYLTPAWGVGLFTIALLATLTALSLDADSTLVPVTLAVIMPIVLVPLIGANVTPRTALVTMVLMALLSLGVLAAVGSANNPVRLDSGAPCATEPSPASDAETTAAAVDLAVDQQTAPTTGTTAPAGSSGSSTSMTTTAPSTPSKSEASSEAGDPPAATPCNPMTLASSGWSFLVHEWAQGPFRGTNAENEAPPKVPLSRNMFLAIGVGYLYLCHRVLRFSGERLRDTIDLSEVHASGDKTQRPSPALQEVLLSGAVTVGAASPDVGSSGGAVTTLASALPQGFIARAFEAVFTRVPVRATVTRVASMPAPAPAAEPAEARPESSDARLPVTAKPVPAADAESVADYDGPVAVLIEHPAYREARVALEIREPSPLIGDVPPIRVAGFSILAYSLSARGMPAWATWNIDGIGLGAWFESRRARRDRQKTGRVGTARQVAPELTMLREALDDHDPRSLLLMLEIASRYYETKRYELAVKYLLRAVNDYPEFPEAWLRLSLAYTRLAETLADGVAPRPEAPLRPAPRRPHDPRRGEGGLDHGLAFLWDRDSVRVGIRSASYRSWANRSLRPLVPGVLGPAASTSDRIRNAEAVIRAQVLDRIPAISIGEGDDARTGEVVVGDADVLPAHFAYLAVACAEECQRRLLRTRLITRCVVVQSQRTFFWRLLISRFGVRRLSAAARSAEVLARVLALDLDVGDDASFERATTVMRQRLTAVYQSVDREGTGWRAPWYLAQALEMLDRPEGTDREPLSGLTAKQLDDRTRWLKTLGERRCRAERAWDPHWLEPSSTRRMARRDRGSDPDAEPDADAPG